MAAQKSIKHQLDSFTNRFKKVKNEPFSEITRRINLAVATMESITLQNMSSSRLSREIKNAARKNFLINIVTAFEIFFNQVIISNAGKWHEKGIADMLSKEKITLLEALEFRSGTRIKPEHLIIFHNKLQNPDSINRLFSSLSGQDFFKKLEAHTFLVVDFDRDDSYDENLETLVPDWKKKFIDLYSLRNRIVHEDITTDLKKDDIDDVAKLAYGFAYVMTNYLQTPL